MSRYRALVGLSYPTDPAVLARLAAGEDVPLGERRMRHVEAGAVVDDLPATSLPWLLGDGLIEAVVEEEHEQAE